MQIFKNSKEYSVRMAHETNKYATTAKSINVHPTTLRRWMRKYETEVRDQMKSEDTSVTPVDPDEKEYKKKYERAIKLLGEKNTKLPY